MRQLLITIILITFLGANAQDKRETVYSLVKQKRTIEWYKSQADLWGKYLETNNKDTEAWLNFYMANRMLKIYNAGVSPHELDSLVETIGEAIPGTFEWHYIAYYNSGLRDLEKDVEHLKKAQELGPDRVELMDDLMTYYVITRDHENIKNQAHRWFESNDISPGIYAWCYNMLQSVDDDAILITVGDNDTYPTWILQQVQGVKPKVEVVNASLIMFKDYRDRYFKELGIPAFVKDTLNGKNYHEMQLAVIDHIKTHCNRPLYYAISSNKALYEPYKDSMYNVGMAYKYCSVKFDNIAVMKKNYEKKFLLDYIKLDLSNDISQGVVDGSNSNYLMTFVTLYHHYVESEDYRAEGIKELIIEIARRTGQLEDVTELL